MQHENRPGAETFTEPPCVDLGASLYPPCFQQTTNLVKIPCNIFGTIITRNMYTVSSLTEQLMAGVFQVLGDKRH